MVLSPARQAKGYTSVAGRFDMALYRCLSLFRLVPQRENEFDTARPGPRRELTGLFSKLSEEQKKAVLAHEEPDVAIPQRKRA